MKLTIGKDPGFRSYKAFSNTLLTQYDLNRMTIKVEAEDFKNIGEDSEKEQDDGKDSLAALDALEKEASEFNKVRLIHSQPTLLS